MRLTHVLSVALCCAAVTATAHGAFLVQTDIDGVDDGPFTPSANFTFGGDTTSASTSVRSDAPLLPEGDSLFGGNGVNDPDTYVYRYDPTTDADNLATGGQFLGRKLNGEPVGGTGYAGGAPGKYRVYAAWPNTTNVNSAGVTYEVVSGANSFSVQVDQNTANDPAKTFSDVWVMLGEIDYDGSSGIIAYQMANVNSFVSMRAAAVMFEPAPEPASCLLASLAAVGLAARRKR